MGYFKKYTGLGILPEVIELMRKFSKMNYNLLWCDNSGLRMQKGYTEIHFIPETDRLRLCIHDDGMNDEYMQTALKIGEDIVLKYGYKKGIDKVDENGALEETENEFYKYF